MSMKRDLSCAETELSNMSVCVESGMGVVDPTAPDERYFEGALQTVQCATLAGSFLVAMWALWAVVDGDYLISLVNCVGAVLIFVLGVQGVRRKERSYLISFLAIAALAASYSLVKFILCATFVLALHGRSELEVQHNFHNSKSKVLTLYALEGLVALSLMAFWTVAAYCTYRLVRLVEERRARAVHRHQLSVIRDSLEASTVAVQVRPSAAALEALKN
eukprot:Gregarina_sp_Pseudo_9__166@NODE_110_length_4202_cov_130_651453_g102_i0_p3_GENE_NODE_110_length_4202_cov_130_651453_g102_i0NODE_110_length_4202_cov_130_651453_g102_i0_p3_ORF_typecomplete_len219_score56_87Mtp/PF03821_16/0_029PTPS_related/PF10131_9/0_1CD20/PF04103_15/2_9DHHC/PF01529_20/1_3e03DHHC/PF01529_20/3_7_NODE_110_length_4202_cov_130_651453_g102_i0269925